MKKPSRLDYAFAVGRVRVLERKLIARAVFSEASEEKNFPAAMKVIFDTGDFQEEMVGIQKSDDLDALIEREEKNIDRLMSELLLDEDILGIIKRESQPDEALVLAERMDYAFIRDYLRHKIDLFNLKILCRAKYSGLSPEKFNSLVLKGGFLDRKIFIENYNRTFSEIGEKLRASPYENLWNRGTDVLQEKETFVELERALEDFLMIYLRKAKYVVFGPEPVFAYILAKKRELSLVRLVGVAKLNHIPIEILKQRISETYV
jgi:V/A-type H+-transporting ATPase subunit C